jgi:hypothetical protein
MRLLGTVALGRLVFTHLALPAVRPVNHVLDGDEIIIRAELGRVISSAAAADGGPGTVVAYEADLIDPVDHLGWSVIIVGRASRLTDPGKIEKYRLVLRPWVAGDMDEFITIRADMVDGFKLDRAESPAQ